MLYIPGPFPARNLAASMAPLAKMTTEAYASEFHTRYSTNVYAQIATEVMKKL